jgi:hypothetical protein
VYGCIAARTDTTQQSGQTPDQKVEINHVTVYINGFTETDPTGRLSLTTPDCMAQQNKFVSSRQSDQTPAAVRV